MVVLGDEDRVVGLGDVILFFGVYVLVGLYIGREVMITVRDRGGSRL